MTGQQIKYVRYLLGQHGLLEQKDEVVMGITDGRTSHLRDLTQDETKSLIDSLTGENDKVKDRMVRKMLSMAHEMNWETGDGKVNIDRVNEWCVKHTSAHKKLNELSTKELAGVVTTFEKVYLSFLKAL